MTKKIATLLLTLIAAFTMAACGSSTPDPLRQASLSMRSHRSQTLEVAAEFYGVDVQDLLERVNEDAQRHVLHGLNGCTAPTSGSDRWQQAARFYQMHHCN